MIQMLRKEACSGGIDDLGHVRSEDCLADCLTKHSAKPDNLLQAVATGCLPNVDCHPPFRSLLKHRAYFDTWLEENPGTSETCVSFLCFMMNREKPSRGSGTPELPDTWSIEQDTIARHHRSWRTSMFTLCPETCPCDISLLTLDRETHVSDQKGGEYCVQDKWTGSRSQFCLDQKWKGKTIFFYKK